jgi:hypothetical protein
VEKASAIHRGSRAFDIFPINADHSNMVKFGEDSPDYRAIAASLQEIQESVRRQSLIVGEQSLKRKRNDSILSASESLLISDLAKHASTDLDSEFDPKLITGEGRLIDL